MKVLALVVATVVITVFTMAGIFAIVLLLPSRSGPALLIGSIGLSLMSYGPLIVGSLLTYFDPHKSRESRRSFARWMIWVGIAELLGAVGVVVATVLGRGPVWLPVVFIAVSAVLIAIAWAISLPLRRYDQRRESKRPAWTGITRQQVMRKVLAMVITFVAAFLVLTILITAVFLIPKEHGFAGAFGFGVVFGLDFGFIAAAFAGIAVTIPISRQVRSLLGRDLGTSRQLRRVVLRGKPDAVPDDLQVGAARYAVVAPVMLGFVLAYTTCLFAGILTGDLMAITTSNDSTIRVVDFSTVGLIVVALAIAYPLQLRYILRARRYAREHADLLDTDQPGGVHP